MLEHPETCGEKEGKDQGDPVFERLRESMGELAVRDAGGDLNLEHQQCHGDGEDRIAEGFEPVLAVHGVTIVLDCAQKRKRGLY